MTQHQATERYTMYLIRDQTENFLVTKRMFASSAKRSAQDYSRNHPGSLVIISLPDTPRQAIQQYRNGVRTPLDKP